MCPLCNGAVQFIGTLGGLSHFKCRDCDIESSADAIDWEVECVCKFCGREDMADGCTSDDCPACEISDSCYGETHQPVGHDLWFCEAH